MVALVVLTLITGVIYPLLVTGIAQVVFPHQANGSMITRRGWQAGRLGADRPAVRRPEVFLGPAVGHRAGAVHRLQRRKLTGSSGSNYGPLNHG